jgi:hypothetical protein
MLTNPHIPESSHFTDHDRLFHGQIDGETGLKGLKRLIRDAFRD